MNVSDANGRDVRPGSLKKPAHPLAALPVPGSRDWESHSGGGPGFISLTAPAAGPNTPPSPQQPTRLSTEPGSESAYGVHGARQVCAFPRQVCAFPRQVCAFPRQVCAFPRQVCAFPRVHPQSSAFTAECLGACFGAATPAYSAPACPLIWGACRDQPLGGSGVGMWDLYMLCIPEQTALDCQHCIQRAQMMRVSVATALCAWNTHTHTNTHHSMPGPYALQAALAGIFAYITKQCIHIV